MNYTLTVPEKIIRKINEDIPEEDYESLLLQCLDIGLNAVNQASLGIDFAMVEKGSSPFHLRWSGESSATIQSWPVRFRHLQRIRRFARPLINQQSRPCRPIYHRTTGKSASGA